MLTTCRCRAQSSTVTRTLSRAQAGMHAALMGALTMMAHVAELPSRSSVLHGADTPDSRRVARAGTMASHNASRGAPIAPNMKNSERQPSAASNTGDSARPSRLPGAHTLGQGAGVKQRAAAAQAHSRTAVEAAERGAEGGGAAGGRNVRSDQVVHGRQCNALTQAHARAGQQHRAHCQACTRHLCAYT